jgi:putative transposase
MIVNDNGTELTANVMFRWQQNRAIEWHYMAPGKPMQNGFRRELQRPAARRVPQLASVRQLPTCPRDHRALAGRL